MKSWNLKKHKLFKIILRSYLIPKSKKGWRQRISDVYLSNIMQVFALSCILLTILTWMAINSGLREEYERFRKDPYSTSIFVNSERFSFNRNQVEKIKITRFDPAKGEFNLEGKGEEIYTGEVFPFSSLDLFFYEKDGGEIRSFRGRTVSPADKKMLRAIAGKLIYKSVANYKLAEDWQDSTRGILVSRYLLERLNYNLEEIGELYRLIDMRYRNETHSFKVPVDILAVAENLPFGDFIVSEGFNYNRIQNTFAPFDMVERFYVLVPPKKKQEFETFVKSRFRYCKEIIEINQTGDGRTRYEVVFESIPFYKQREFKELRNESAKYSIARQFRDSGYECLIDYYDWKPLPGNKNQGNPEFLTLYLNEKYIDHLDELGLFFRESIGGVGMDDTIRNIFQSYHKDMRRFRKISIILYMILIGLGIFVSVAMYIKSVQVTTLRLGVFSSFGVSSSFLSFVLAVESVVIFLLSFVIALILYYIAAPLLVSGAVTMMLTAWDVSWLIIVGTVLSFVVVLYTVKSMLKKTPYSLMEYRS